MNSHHQVNVLIKALLKYDYPIPVAILYEETKHDDFELSLPLNELSRMGLIDMAYDRSGYETYLIPLRIRNSLNSVPEEGANDIYGYLLKLEKEQKDHSDFVSSLTHNKLKLEVSDLENRLKDYENVKRQARLGLIIAGLAAIASIISIFT